MENNLVKNMMSIGQFIEEKRNSNMPDSDLNWELKGYINSMIDQAEKQLSIEINNARDTNIINSKEWFEAHAVISIVWFEMRKIIADMWFENELTRPDAEEIFMRKAEDKFINKLKNIESENLRNFLL